MNKHNIVMTVSVVLLLASIGTGLLIGYGAELGLLLLLCPIMMLGMMYFMTKTHQRNE